MKSNIPLMADVIPYPTIPWLIRYEPSRTKGTAPTTRIANITILVDTTKHQPDYSGF